MFVHFVTPQWLLVLYVCISVSFGTRYSIQHTNETKRGKRMVKCAISIVPSQASVDVYEMRLFNIIDMTIDLLNKNLDLSPSIKNL